MTGILRPEFIARYTTQVRERQLLRDRLWAERNAQAALVEETVPGFNSFGYILEVVQNVGAAMKTGVFKRLKDEGLARTHAEHLTNAKLRSGCAAWRIDWLTPQVLSIDTTQDQPRNVDCMQHATLTVSVDESSRIIDTEFYSWNAALGEDRNPFEDTEKLHIAWSVPLNNSPPELRYVGFGSNEPHDTEHPEKLAKVAVPGKPRFYVYDVENDRRIIHQVTWNDVGTFDWDWSYVTPQKQGTDTLVEFVRFPDGSLFCVSDRYVAAAAAGQTRDMLLANFWSGEKLPGIPPRFQDLGTKVSRDFSSLFTRTRARVAQGQVITPRGTAPVLSQVIDAARRDYAAYFVATAGAEARGTELVSAWWRLKGIRESQYKAFLDATTSEIFLDEVAAVLPGSGNDVLSADLSRLPTDTRLAVDLWRTGILEQIRADLYFYGQYPDVRLGRLLFAVELAMSTRYGSLYSKVIEQAVIVMNKGQSHGAFDLVL